MATETERKFRVTNESWRENAAPGKQYRQGYLSRGKNTVRVRVAADKAYLTIKGPSSGISRAEYEYEIPAADAEEMLKLCEGFIISKTRFIVMHGHHRWELDIFEAENEGLVIAEIELGSEDEVFDLPEWAGEELSHDPRFSNAALSRIPWSQF